MKKLGILAAGGVLALLMLTGCGTEQVPAGSGEAAQPARTSPTETQAMEPEEIRPAETEQNGSDPEDAAHAHSFAEAPQTVEDPVSGYCGNTVTDLILDGARISFWGDDSVRLTDILINLNYQTDQVCRCPLEFTVDTEFGEGYGVNLTEGFARWEGGQASLTEEQVQQIRDILDRNCA